MTLKPCVVCGTPTNNGPRCPEHTVKDQRINHRRDTARSAWNRLSVRARTAQPFCTLCNSPKNLQADHSPRAWARIKLRKSVRLCDVTVLCGRCNSRAGSSQPGSARYERWAELDGDVTATHPDWTLAIQGRAPLSTVPQASRGVPFASHTATQADAPREPDETAPRTAERASASSGITPQAAKPGEGR